MNWDLYLAFCLATAILIMIPGPAISLIVATSLAHGGRAALITVAGSSSAILLQVFIVALGMTSLIAVLAEWFEWLRWLGVAYLVYLGIMAWRAKPETLEEANAKNVAGGRLFLRGFIVNATNPKTLIFYVAFFPQFVDPNLSAGPQLALLGATFLIIATVIDSSYALLGGHLRSYLKSKRAALIRNRLTGGLLMLAGCGLALARRS